jgi:hypothetical protein
MGHSWKGNSIHRHLIPCCPIIESQFDIEKGFWFWASISPGDSKIQCETRIEIQSSPIWNSLKKDNLKLDPDNELWTHLALSVSTRPFPSWYGRHCPAYNPSSDTISLLCRVKLTPKIIQLLMVEPTPPSMSSEMLPSLAVHKAPHTASSNRPSGQPGSMYLRFYPANIRREQYKRRRGITNVEQ